MYGSPQDLVQDPYIFKIVPLPYRTWIYHYYFGDSSHSARTVGEHGIMEQVLGMKVIDASRNGGLWSPAICCAPSAIFSVLTADFTTVVGCLFATIFNILASIATNNPRWYRFNRLISFVPRFVFCCFVCVRMGIRSGDGGLALMAFLAIIGCLLIDFIFGDIVAFMGIAWHCSYRIVRILPNRIFVCRQEGAAFIPDPEGGREIDEIVSGSGFFHEMAIIVETRGLVVMLKPMDLADWMKVWEERTNTSRPVSFVGLDVFSKNRRTASDVHMQHQTKKPEGAKEALIAMVAAQGAPALLE